MRITIDIPDTYVDAMMELRCIGGGCVFRHISSNPSGISAGMGCSCIDVDRGQRNAAHQNRAVKATMERITKAIAEQLNAPVGDTTT